MKTQEQKIEPWIERLREVIRRKHLAWSTEQQYCQWVRQYLAFCFTQPATAKPEQKFEAFLTMLALVRDVSASTQNSAFHAIRFFYLEVAKVELGKIDGLRAQRRAHLRHAPSVPDTHALLDALPDVGGYPTALIGRILYARGLRVTEPLNVRLKDVRWDHRELFIMGAKGGKDRVVRLDEWMIAPLQRQMVVALTVWERDVRNQVHLEIPHQLAKKYPETRFSKHWAWLFPAHQPCRHPRTGEIVRYRMHEVNVQRAFKLARKTTGVLATPHNMRHAHATHLLDAGVNVKALQEEMGHVDVRTTMGYCHAEATSVPDPHLIVRQSGPVIPQLPRREIQLNINNDRLEITAL